MEGSVVNFTGRHEAFSWDGEQACWIDGKGHPVSKEKEQELIERAADVFQRQMMDRLEIVRASFHCMGSTKERKAAFEWLRESYGL